MRSLTALFLALPLFCACDVLSPSYVGSGLRGTETRPLDPFREIAVAGSVDVEVRVGAGPSVTIACDENLLGYVRTEIDGDRLEIRMERGSYSFQHPLSITVGAPELRAASLAGSGALRIHGLSGADFEVDVAGSGVVEAAGEVGELEVSIAGSGDARLVELAARRVRISVAGSGDVEVSASDSLDVSIAGSGDVRYAGEPAVSRSIAGSGGVRPLGR